MRTYKFGTINAWLDNREPVEDIWKAYVTNHLPDEVVFVYEGNELIGTIACDDVLWDRWNCVKLDDGHVKKHFVNFLFEYIKDNLIAVKNIAEDLIGYRKWVNNTESPLKTQQHARNYLSNILRKALDEYGGS